MKIRLSYNGIWDEVYDPKGINLADVVRAFVISQYGVHRGDRYVNISFELLWSQLPQWKAELHLCPSTNV